MTKSEISIKLKSDEILNKNLEYFVSPLKDCIKNLITELDLANKVIDEICKDYSYLKDDYRKDYLKQSVKRNYTNWMDIKDYYINKNKIEFGDQINGTKSKQF